MLPIRRRLMTTEGAGCEPGEERVGMHNLSLCCRWLHCCRAYQYIFRSPIGCMVILLPGLLMLNKQMIAKRRNLNWMSLIH